MFFMNTARIQQVDNLTEVTLKQKDDVKLEFKFDTSTLPNPFIGPSICELP